MQRDETELEWILFTLLVRDHRCEIPWMTQSLSFFVVRSAHPAADPPGTPDYSAIGTSTETERNSLFLVRVSLFSPFACPRAKFTMINCQLNLDYVVLTP